MIHSIPFIRTIFTMLSVIIAMTYTTTLPSGSTASNAVIGLMLGLLLSGTFFLIEKAFKGAKLRGLTTLTLGLFIGYLLGHALHLITQQALALTGTKIQLDPSFADVLRMGLFLFGTYMGVIFTLKHSDEIYLSLPFVQLSPSVKHRREIILDLSILYDVRLLDLCASRLLDGQLVVPSYIVSELENQTESADEETRCQAKRALEHLKKLEALEHLGMKKSSTDFPDVEDLHLKNHRLARHLGALILVSDASKLRMPQGEEVDIININALSNALKPVMQAGEKLHIKVQRFGKEPRQGVGYLEDGTMVVINNGGDFIGESIETQVISLKQTSAGRIIFTNAMVKASSTQETSETLEPLTT